MRGSLRGAGQRSAPSALRGGKPTGDSKAAAMSEMLSGAEMLIRALQDDVAKNSVKQKEVHFS